jgi:hypothetical protein
MDSIRIETGVKRIAINDDPTRVIEFNPSDVLFAERFYALMQEFEAKQVEYERRSQELDARKDEKDDHGLPANLGDGLAFLREVCEFMRAKIDGLFGAGTSQKAFGDALELEVFEQFFSGITPFIQRARDEKVRRYLNQQNAGRVME